MLKQKIVLVTGASKGIGECIAEHFLLNNYKVACGYVKNKPKQCDSQNRYNVNIDQSDRESVKRAITAIEKYFGGTIDILINNGAVAQEKPFLNIDDKDWSNMLNINLQGPFRTTQEVIPRMIEKKWGRIINITSIGGQWGGYNQVHYAASKAGLISFTQSIAKIYSREGITSNAISPGLVATQMSENELNTESGKEKVNNIPMGRLGTKKEIAQIALFLASDDSSYITGQTLNANGGMYFG